MLPRKGIARADVLCAIDTPSVAGDLSWPATLCLPHWQLTCSVSHGPREQNRIGTILAAAVFHHLREDAEWEAVFGKCYAALKPGGSLWISDLIAHDDQTVQLIMWQRYGEYLTQLKGETYRDQVFGYIEQEDTPRPLLYQLHLLKQAGFRSVEVLHKHSMFAAFGGIK